mgnify:CR=1 FL=1
MNIHGSTKGVKTAVGYVRVSTQEQAAEGVSLDAQRDKLRSYCRANGIRLIDIFADEGMSGSTQFLRMSPLPIDPPALQRPLDAPPSDTSPYASICSDPSAELPDVCPQRTARVPPAS